MKGKMVFPLMVAGSLMLAACGDDGTDKEPEVEADATQTDDGTAATDETPTEDAAVGGSEDPDEPVSSDAADVTGQEEMQQKMDEINYTEFELEVEYADGKEYEAEIEKKSDNTVKAEIEDSLNGVKKKGLDAFNDLFPLVEQMDITTGTDKAEAIRQVLSTFSLPDDYTKFELELRFKDDGKEYEIEDRK
ncbi:YusW family protein [Bhargavaea ullalensis]|uniref:YusW-like protein n=1 Tax=Bhargavaea ullalensis TaxID=1265685 RepID=A0ABV2GBE3_9BACL